MSLEVLGREQLHMSGDVHQLVTFLNRALKTRGLIFGLARGQSTREYVITIYHDPSSDYEHGLNPACLRAQAPEKDKGRDRS